MEITKREKINSLTNEVEQLHPILLELFKKMPLKYVEYTHGTNEKGADFILVQTDTILNKDEYIGVIVKSKKILQNFSEIENQIKECYLFERYLENGRRKIRFDKLWIVTSQTISKNAVDKIYELFKDNNIVFLQDTDLINLFERYVPEFWENKSVFLTQYYKALKEKLLILDRQNQIINSDKYFYIEHDIEIVKQTGTIQPVKHKKRKKIDILQEVISNQISVIEGGIGFGKSKLLRNIALKLIEKQGEDVFIPIYCSYTEFKVNYNSNIDNLLKMITINMKEFSNVKVILLFDAVDEINLNEKAISKTLYEDINAILSYHSTYSIHCVFTMRFLPYYDSANEIHSFIQCYSIKPLSFSKSIAILNEFCSEVLQQKRIYEDLKKSNLFRELPKSPIATLLLASIIKKDGVYDLPCSMTELYSKYTELMLGRWDIEKGLKKDLEYQVSKNFIEEFAFNFIQKQIFNTSYDDALNLLTKYFNERNISQTISPQKILDFLIYDSGLLILTDNQEIFFKHRSFIEFFTAQRFYTRKSLKISNNIFYQFWANIYYFYIGLCKDSEDDLKEMFALVPASEEERWGKILFLGNYLLAGNLTPYKVIEDNLYSIFIEASKLYSEIRKKEIISPFALFSPQILLFFIQSIMQENYSYTFFHKAMELTCLKIDEHDNFEEKLYALYFLSCAECALNKYAVLEYLLTNYCHKLNLEIQLALDFSLKSSDNTPSKLYEKNNKILKSISRSQNFKEAVTLLVQKPIMNIEQISQRKNELFDNYNITLLADKSISKEELLNELEKFYSKEKQEQYGVLGIEVTF